MLGRVIFCAVIAAAVLAVVLLATVSPVPHRSPDHDKSKSSPPAAPGTTGSTRSITVYIHPAAASASGPGTQQQQRGAHGEQQRQQAASPSALVFRHRMTAGPDAASRTVGAASGFALPAGGRGHSSAKTTMSAFDTVHLAFDGAMSGSICVEAAAAGSSEGDKGMMRVVGGTGAFAFAQGHAVLRGGARGKRSPAASAPLRLELSVASAG
ncbi:uncharacterized protein LOC100833740 [Brachypodium distachyon]|uniref:Dirigent protein n=1 Tax=Brachypodium distachyon TaxID=15368 RepID=I1GNI0_BRADI|nr:uncharacterized protein LOC100833740 [Brachypodium distachyon]KQK13301.1 hypothetical protein BRADI_1g09230v3 [Brachypodium distachyon]|eukprot:XP_003559444.1 uncharacterized protein LOC100833740 [Brachypodium distachyon]